MNRYKKLMCVKGLILSMDEQLYQHFQKGTEQENLKERIISPYYNAILEQLSEPEKAKEDTNEKT